MHATALVRALPLLLAAAASHAQDVHWYTLVVDGARTGFVRMEHSANADEVTERETMTLFVRELGRTARIERDIVYRHDDNGVPLGFDYELKSGVAPAAWRGTFEQGTLRIRPRAPRGGEVSVPLPDDTVFTPDPSVRFAALWSGRQDSADVVAFDPQRRSAGLMRARRLGDDDIGRHVHVTTGAPPDAGGEDLWFDAEGRLLRAEEPVFGASVVWTPCARDCDRDAEAPLDFMNRLVVRSPVQIPEWFRHRTLRFVLARTDGAPVLAAATDEQAVAPTNRTAVLTICANCGAAEHPTAQELARYLAPNAWVQSDNAEIRTLARNTVSPAMPVDTRMRKLVKLVKQRMHGSNDFLGFGDALGALHSGSGDCTEFSVLLAAFARSQGIPTRIVAGLAYSDRFSGKKDVFSPHVWVQAWNGARWVSYDAGLGEFDSTHIALAVGDGEPDEIDRATTQLPLLRIEKAGVVRDR